MILLVVCGIEITSNTSAQSPSGQGRKTSTKVKADFSTPAAAVETFFAAAAARDAGLLSQCFASNAAKEFDKVRKKMLAKKELDGIAAEFGSGKVVDVKQNETRASVAVKLKSRDERIDLTKTAGGWKILDF
jgi:methionyl-tRNA formyltransferase